MYKITPLTGSILIKVLWALTKMIKMKFLKKTESNIVRQNQHLFPLTIDCFTSSNSEIITIFRGSKKYPFLSIYVHGSWADNTRTSFSDLDDFIVVDDLMPTSLITKLKAELWLNKVDMRMRRIDPLQHHGHWIINASQLANYDNSYMPIIVLKNAIRVQGATKINVQVNVEKSSLGIIKNIYNCTKSTEFLFKKYIQNKINVFEMKGLVGNILLMPAYVFQARGEWVSKKHAIESSEELFSREACEAIKTCSEIRNQWGLALENRRFKALKVFTQFVKTPLLHQKIAKAFAPRFPVEKFKTISISSVEALIKESNYYVDKKRP